MKDLYLCPHCCGRYRTPEEKEACASQDFDKLFKGGEEVIIRLPRVPNFDGQKARVNLVVEAISDSRSLESLKGGIKTFVIEVTVVKTRLPRVPNLDGQKAVIGAINDDRSLEGPSIIHVLYDQLAKSEAGQLKSDKEDDYPEITTDKRRR